MSAVALAESGVAGLICDCRQNLISNDSGRLLIAGRVPKAQAMIANFAKLVFHSACSFR